MLLGIDRAASVVPYVEWLVIVELGLISLCVLFALIDGVIWLVRNYRRYGRSVRTPFRERHLDRKE